MYAKILRGKVDMNGLHGAFIPGIVEPLLSEGRVAEHILPICQLCHKQSLPCHEGCWDTAGTHPTLPLHLLGHDHGWGLQHTAWSLLANDVKSLYHFTAGRVGGRGLTAGRAKSTVRTQDPAHRLSNLKTSLEVILVAFFMRQMPQLLNRKSYSLDRFSF